jgi:hypothetical protein
MAVSGDVRDADRGERGGPACADLDAGGGGAAEVARPLAVPLYTSMLLVLASMTTRSG